MYSRKISARSLRQLYEFMPALYRPARIRRQVGATRQRRSSGGLSRNNAREFASARRSAEDIRGTRAVCRYLRKGRGKVAIPLERIARNEQNDNSKRVNQRVDSEGVSWRIEASKAAEAVYGNVSRYKRATDAI